MHRIKNIFLVVAVSLISVSAFSVSTTTALKDITEAVTRICSQPDKAGEYWDVDIKGTGEATVRLRLPSGKVTGLVKLDKKQW